jgi:hypothetical protein
MSQTIPYSVIKEPELLDIVDEEWETDKLPNDGTLSAFLSQGYFDPYRRNLYLP